jgi:putative ABC transport system substrate-binding protein
MPASNVSREMVEAGLLMSYGTNIASMFRRVGIYTGSILKGATPADLPVIQSTKFEFVINARTAKVLGIELSPLLLTRARLNDGVDGPP